MTMPTINYRQAQRDYDSAEDPSLDDEGCDEVTRHTDDEPHENDGDPDVRYAAVRRVKQLQEKP